MTAETYAAEAARFLADHPELEGMAPCCGWCANRERDIAITTEAHCTVDQKTRQYGTPCDNHGFVYDPTPAWELWPWYGDRAAWEKDGMAYDTARRIKEHVADGGDANDLPTFTVGGQTWVVPPKPRKDKHSLSQHAYALDPYEAEAATVTEDAEKVHPVMQFLRDRQAARVSTMKEELK